MAKIKNCKMLLENLPRGGKCIKDTAINWSKSIGYEVGYIYDGKQGIIKILDYKNGRLTIEHNGVIYDDKPIKAGNFLNGKIGYYIGEITDKFKIELGERLVGEKRDITIIDREYRDNPHNKGKKTKWYKYKCNKCPNEDWILESAIISQEVGCNACCEFNKKPKLGINTIWDTDRWMCDLGVSEEDAKTHTYSSEDTIEVVCPDCGNKKKAKIYNIYFVKSIKCICNDSKVSYPEKFMNALLTNLKLEFNYQLSSKTFDWVGEKRYDFYIPSLNMIIETHGEQHYRECNRKGARTLEQEQENDRLKKELALSNGVEHYIVIDCRESNLEWIKNSVINSELVKLFDLSKIDWDKCEEFALSNIVKKICDIWNNKENWETCSDISKRTGFARGTISKWLQKADKLGWTNYNAKEELTKARRKLGKNGKQVEVFKDDISLGIFDSCHELERQSEEKFGVKFVFARVASACKSERLYKGYRFVYI